MKIFSFFLELQKSYTFLLGRTNAPQSGGLAPDAGRSGAVAGSGRDSLDLARDGLRARMAVITPVTRNRP